MGRSRRERVLVSSCRLHGSRSARRCARGARRTPTTSSPRRAATPHAEQRLAGRDLHRPTRRSARSPPRTSSSRTPPAIPRSASPSSSSGTNRGPLGPEEPIGELKTVHVDLPVGLSVNPQATEQCPQADASKPAPASARLDSESATSHVTGSVARRRSRRSPITGRRLQHRTARRASPPASASASPAATTSSCAPTSTGTATSTRASRSTCRNCRSPAPDRRPDPQKPPRLQRPLRRRHLHHHPVDLLRPGNRSRHMSTSTRPTCSPPRSPKRQNPGYEFPASAEPALESPLPPGKKPIDCAGIPYDPSTGVEPNTAETDSPVGRDDRGRGPAHHRRRQRARAPTPRKRRSRCRSGWGSTPRPANGLVACTRRPVRQGHQQPGRLSRRRRRSARSRSRPRRCPSGSLTGDVFVGNQLSRDPASGDEYRIFVDADVSHGTASRCACSAGSAPTRSTGQLTTRLQRTCRRSRSARSCSNSTAARRRP